jgi:broad specificity phosphatase PhoE
VAPRLGPLSWVENKIYFQLAKRRWDEQLAKRPRRIILVRHGQSQGNVDDKVYATVPDSQIALTERGFAQAVVAGLQIRSLVGNGTVRCFYSPYLRTKQTMLAILQAFDSQRVLLSSEPRLREQDFGNFQNMQDMKGVFQERQKFGRFYYRFPNGEAGTDVFDRTASFITYLFRTMSGTGYFAAGQTRELRQQRREAELADFEELDEFEQSPAGERPADNYLLITHGLLMRIFCMCYLRWTTNEFEQVWNPSNCEIWVLEAQPGSGKYGLAGRWRATPYGGSFTDIKFGEGRNQPLYEHMRRPSVTRAVTPGTPDALAGDELAHLRNLPGPVRVGRRAEGNGNSSRAANRAMMAGDAVLEYWKKDSSTSSSKKDKEQ